MKILAIDDEVLILNLFASFFGRRGHEVCSCLSAAEALGHLRDEEFDVILLDLIMPGMDGNEFIRHAFKMGIETPIIVVTAYSGKFEPETPLNPLIVSKPVDCMELEEHMLDAVARSKAIHV